MALVMYDPQEFGKNLELILDTLGITQAEFSERTQISQTELSQIISGTRMPKLEAICKILGVLPVKFERLMGDK